MAKAIYYRGKKPILIARETLVEVAEMLRRENLLGDLASALRGQGLDLEALAKPAGRRPARGRSDASEALGADASFTIDLPDEGVPVEPKVVNRVKRFMVTSGLARTNATAADVAQSKQRFSCTIPPP